MTPTMEGGAPSHVVEDKGGGASPDGTCAIGPKHVTWSCLSCLHNFALRPTTVPEVLPMTPVDILGVTTCEVGVLANAAEIPLGICSR